MRKETQQLYLKTFKKAASSCSSPSSSWSWKGAGGREISRYGAFAPQATITARNCTLKFTLFYFTCFLYFILNVDSILPFFTFQRQAETRTSGDACHMIIGTYFNYRHLCKLCECYGVWAAFSCIDAVVTAVTCVPDGASNKCDSWVELAEKGEHLISKLYLSAADEKTVLLVQIFNYKL